MPAPLLYPQTSKQANKKTSSQLAVYYHQDHFFQVKDMLFIFPSPSESRE